jgi:hypothetical protein
LLYRSQRKHEYFGEHNVSAGSAAAFVHVPGQRERMDAVPALADLVAHLERPLDDAPGAWSARGREAFESAASEDLLSDVAYYELQRICNDSTYSPGGSTARHLVLYNGPAFVLAVSVHPPQQTPVTLQSLNRDTLVALVTCKGAELRRYRQEGALDAEHPGTAPPLTALTSMTMGSGDIFFIEAKYDIVDLRSAHTMVTLSLASPSKCDVVWGYDVASLACVGARTADAELLWTWFLIGLAAHHGDAESARELSRIGAESIAASAKTKARESIAAISERLSWPSP